MKFLKKKPRCFYLSALCRFALGFLCGACPIANGVYPFGVALLCGAGEGFVFIGAGALLSCLFFGTYKIVTAIGVLYTLSVRLAFRKRKNTLTRTLLLSFAYSALLCVTMLTESEYLLYDTVRIICVGLLPPMFALITFYGKEHRIFGEVFPLVLGFTVLRALDGVSFYGIKLSVAAAALLTALKGKEKGFPFSGIAGFVFGLGAEIRALPLMGIFGLVHGLFAADTPIFSVILAYMLAVSAGGYILSFEGVALYAVALGIGCIIYLPFSLKKQVNAAPAGALPITPTARLASGFSSLSNLFYVMSDVKSPPARDTVYSMVSERVDELCGDCAMCDRGQVVTALSDAVTEGGCEASVSKNCPNYLAFSALPGEIKQQNDRKTAETYLSFAGEYKCFAGMLSQMATQAEEEKTEDETLISPLEKALEENGIYFEQVRVTGKRCRKAEIFGVNPDSIKLSGRDFSRIVGKAVGRCVSPPEFNLCGDKVTAVFETVPCLKTECVRIVSAREGEKACGDTVSMFEYDNRFYSIVADGMGSGTDAGMVSRLSALYLEKLVGVGADLSASLLMLGDTLTKAPGETFTTVDILEADKVLATAKITKAGASPSFLLRGEKQYIIKSKTPPLGIIKEVKQEQTVFSLRRGDIILMVSDGVEVSPKSIEYAFGSGKSLKTAASKLAELSRKSGSEDDMSVCAVRFY